MGAIYFKLKDLRNSALIVRIDDYCARTASPASQRFDILLLVIYYFLLLKVGEGVLIFSASRFSPSNSYRKDKSKVFVCVFLML